MPRMRTALFWQKLFIYCWVFSAAGYVFEVLLAQMSFFATAAPPAYPRMDTTLPLALPYGLGVVAIILFVIAPFKRQKLQWPVVFLLTMLLATVVEYLSALVVVGIYGTNPFWDYSNLPFGLQGYVSLGSSVVFGILGMWFVYWLYPACEKLFARVDARTMAIAFWVLFASYGADLLVTYAVPLIRTG